MAELSHRSRPTTGSTAPSSPATSSYLQVVVVVVREEARTRAKERAGDDKRASDKWDEWGKKEGAVVTLSIVLQEDEHEN